MRFYQQQAGAKTHPLQALGCNALLIGSAPLFLKTRSICHGFDTFGRFGDATEHDSPEFEQKLVAATCLT
jgi:hypothetical protein